MLCPLIRSPGLGLRMYTKDVPVFQTEGLKVCDLSAFNLYHTDLEGPLDMIRAAMLLD